MKWLLQLFGFGAGQPARRASSPHRLYIIDGSGLLENYSGRQRNGNFQPHPRDHVQILKTLSQFTAREEVNMIAVLTGRALREAGEGASFKGITVHYVENTDQLKNRIVELIRKNIDKKEVLVLTSEPQIEQASATAGASCMRLSTFKKAFEDRPMRRPQQNDRPDRQERSDRSDRPERQDRQDRQDRPERADQPDRPEDSSSEPPEPNEPGDNNNNKENRSVLDLIDPV